MWMTTQKSLIAPFLGLSWSKVKINKGQEKYFFFQFWDGDEKAENLIKHFFGDTKKAVMTFGQMTIKGHKVDIATLIWMTLGIMALSIKTPGIMALNLMIFGKWSSNKWP
jgi:hypothetical protein